MSQDKAHSPPQFEPEQSLRENERRLAADMERKTVEAKLKAQSERFQRIIENTDAGYFRMGTDGCYEDVNPAWLRMYGFSSREDIVGQHFSLVQHTEDLAKAEEIVEALIRGEPVRSGEFSRLRRDRTVGYHTFSAVPVLDDDRVIGIEGFLIDISRTKAHGGCSTEIGGEVRQGLPVKPCRSRHHRSHNGLLPGC